MLKIDLFCNRPEDEKKDPIEVKKSSSFGFGGFGGNIGNLMSNKNYHKKQSSIRATPKSHSCAPFICGDVYRVTEESEDV